MVAGLVDEYPGQHQGEGGVGESEQERGRSQPVLPGQVAGQPLYELAAHPDIQHQAREAALAGDDKHLEAVLEEGMRLHPVIAATARKLTRDLTIGGWDLPAGTVVTTSILLAHQRQDSYADPFTFRPSRFLDGEVAPNTWLPFGGGVRRCIGAGFSLMEGTTVLREVLSRHTLALPAGANPERGHVRNITDVPRHRARIVITAREDAHRRA
ncbi:MAG: cytochrome P450 [Hyphomicrobiales bacterium]|nr:MAG: cytochrome P450 [Hyphomicrobiales bacterium]